MSVEKKIFGTLSDGREVSLYKIINAKGESVSFIDYGAAIVSIMVHDREGNLKDIALGCDNAAAYEQQTACLGAVPGRYANRIEKGTFVLNGKTFHLAVNNGPNHLHGGPTGFHRRLWNGEICDDNTVIFTRLSCDGEEGYPGNLMVCVKYTFDQASRLSICYQALSDQDTILNLTNHTYFNLNGHDSGSVEGQELQIFADSFTENDSNCLPTGRIVNLSAEEGRVMDFRSPKTIGKDLHKESIHLKNASGYDHNYVLEKNKEGIAAKAYSSDSGITMECKTTQPGIQLYTGNFLEDSNIQGKNGAVYHNFDGFCLETQHFPDAIRHTHFPKVILKMGELYKETTEYSFGIK